MPQVTSRCRRPAPECARYGEIEPNAAPRRRAQRQVDQHGYDGRAERRLLCETVGRDRDVDPTERLRPFARTRRSLVLVDPTGRSGTARTAVERSIR
jgi:hypothetical protein